MYFMISIWWWDFCYCWIVGGFEEVLMWNINLLFLKVGFVVIKIILLGVDEFFVEVECVYVVDFWLEVMFLVC